jgi:hypothetical protein
MADPYQDETMKQMLTIATVAAGLFAVGCADHSEDFQTPAPAAVAPEQPAAQPVTPATTSPAPDVHP